MIAPVTKQDLEQMEERLNKKLRSLRSSLQYDVRQSYERIINNTLTPASSSSVTSVAALLEVSLPISATEDFEKFDTSVRENTGKRNALVT